jgi:hypothetical protein
LDLAKRAAFEHTLGSESKGTYEFAIDDFVFWYSSEQR